MSEPLHILLIDDDEIDRMAIRRALSAVRPNTVIDERSDQTSGLAALRSTTYDCVITDYRLPDGDGVSLLERAAGDNLLNCPVIVLTGKGHYDIDLAVMEAGGADYLEKDDINPATLDRSVRYAVERHRLVTNLLEANQRLNHMAMELREMSLHDDLTGTANRRGFMALAQQQLAMSRRTGRKLVLFFIDLDGLKHINDTFGHGEGDAAIVETAGVLRETFRESDIIGRLGGDEFAVLAIDASGANAEILKEHLQENLNRHNAREHRRYSLSVSLGSVQFDPAVPASLEELLSEADSLMYENKVARGQQRERGALAATAH
ncbi:MAG: GGDEF domain-containing response regulator [candidate division Zixibacteria bacterium]|nr:GGDEF domain-containing response regulator [candidate division Zixibacteria bacterium]